MFDKRMRDLWDSASLDLSASPIVVRGFEGMTETDGLLFGPFGELEAALLEGQAIALEDVTRGVLRGRLLVKTVTPHETWTHPELRPFAKARAFVAVDGPLMLASTGAKLRKGRVEWRDGRLSVSDLADWV